MEQFNTIEGVSNLFRNANCIGQDNCYFISYISISTSGGLLGGFVSAMESKMENKCDGYLVNQTESGIGLIPLNSDGMSYITNNPKKMKANVEACTFIQQADIKKVTIKNANLISLVTKEVTIELINGRKYNWLVNKKEKTIPYHEENFAKFMNMYKK